VALFECGNSHFVETRLGTGGVPGNPSEEQKLKLILGKLTSHPPVECLEKWGEMRMI